MKEGFACEANSSSSSEDILYIPTIQYRVHKGPPPVPTLKQTILTHTLTPYFFNVNLIIFPSYVLQVVCAHKIFPLNFCMHFLFLSNVNCELRLNKRKRKM
jgi:hypothetical protein